MPVLWRVQYSALCAVNVNERRHLEEITDASGTDFLPVVELSVRGEITQEEPAEWDSDAKVVVKG